MDRGADLSVASELAGHASPTTPARSKGRVLTGAEDDLLAKFQSAIDAVTCALDIQQEVSQRNKERPPELRLSFKLAVHVGEVLAEGARIHGEGVQVVLGLVDFAGPGGLCISRAAREQVEGGLRLDSDSIGPVTIRGVPKRIRGYRVRTGAETELLPPLAEGQTRLRLAAILKADVAGWSRLMAENEEHTVATVRDFQVGIDAITTQYGGRVVDFVGDNFLAEFRSALDAVQAAIAIQGAITEANTRFPSDRKMQFRIGVHLGDVRVEGERIFGEGINIAARLEALAEPGGDLYLGTVRDQVRRKLDLTCEDLGDQILRNIPDPVHTYRVRGSRVIGG